MKHLFGVDEDDVMTWSTERWARYRLFAERWAKAQGWEA